MSAKPQAHAGRREPTAAEFRAMQEAPQFIELKKTFRSFAFPMSAAFFAWYVAYVLMATYMSDMMATPAFGSINVGVLLGLAQFVTTYAITWWYIRFANKQIEPRAAAIRAEMEG